MALDTYTDLLAAAANWSSRADLTSRIPEFIELAEAKINRRLREKDMVTKNAAFSITGEYVAVPASFGGVKTFYLNTSPKQNLDFMADDLMTGLFAGSGRPRHYNTQGSNFRFGPAPDATYSSTLVYYLKVPALTGGAPTNWLLTDHPDAYLYGVQAEECGFMKDFSGAAGWTDAMYRVIDEIKSASARDSWGGNAMAVRVE